MTITDTHVDELADLEIDVELPSKVIVWDDPVNTMDYVVLCFRKVFGWPLAKCRAKMLEVHHEGRSIVFAGSRDEAEVIAAKIRSYQLWATVER